MPGLTKKQEEKPFSLARYWEVGTEETAANLRFINAIYMRKVEALRTCARLLRDVGDVFPVLAEDDRKPFMAYVGDLAANARLPAVLDACRLWLDLVCPGWLEESPALLGTPTERGSPANYAWRAAVLKRDKKTCRSCGAKKRLHAHHIIPWASSVAGRVDVGNGVTLCVGCHREQHKNMGAALWR